MKQTVEGITIERTDVSLSARPSICFNPEFDSNEIDESDLHSAKHDEQRISTFRGMIID
jgi:hypothetical protein